MDRLPVTNSGVAVNRRWSNPDGSRGEETVWFRVSAWHKLAETRNTFLGHGHRVLDVGVPVGVKHGQHPVVGNCIQVAPIGQAPEIDVHGGLVVAVSHSLSD